MKAQKRIPLVIVMMPSSWFWSETDRVFSTTFETHQKHPLPATQSTDASHLEDTICHQSRACSRELLTQKVDGESLRSLLLLVVEGKRIQASGDKSSFAETEQKSGGEESTEATLEGLKCGDKTPSEDLTTNPNARSEAVEHKI